MCTQVGLKFNSNLMNDKKIYKVGFEPEASKENANIK